MVLEKDIKIDEKTGIAYIENEEGIETCHLYLGLNTPMNINLLEELGLKYAINDIEIVKDSIYNIKILRGKKNLRQYCRCRVCKERNRNV